MRDRVQLEVFRNTKAAGNQESWSTGRRTPPPHTHTHSTHTRTRTRRTHAYVPASKHTHTQLTLCCDHRSHARAHKQSTHARTRTGRIHSYVRASKHMRTQATLCCIIDQSTSLPTPKRLLCFEKFLFFVDFTTGQYPAREARGGGRRGRGRPLPCFLPTGIFGGFTTEHSSKVQI